MVKEVQSMGKVRLYLEVTNANFRRAQRHICIRGALLRKMKILSRGNAPLL